MGEFLLKALSDPNFYLGIVSVLVTLVGLLYRRGKKRLFFDVVCDVELEFDPEGQDSESDGQTEGVFHRRLFVIELQNGVVRYVPGLLGGPDIAPAQYERDISFRFGGRRIVEAAVIEQDPPDIGADVSIGGSHDDELILKPVLLNEGDSIRLKAVVENRTVYAWGDDGPIIAGHVSASGRILGIKTIQKRWTADQLIRRGATLFVVVFVGFDTIPRSLAWIITGAPT
jgi:hypothetical protein